ncbi:corticotropin-releasing factor-binding protein [Pseudomyrmex gracilis]|uniref:corticotropin-releasing factor-binding protein n=1 Tax=Pseudomyrmex gracilis TaxID=219809 RepID=UPI000994AF89|nr:corticotropin-releasing factor-binding protein [Pseudomyrmex gracilis]
MFCKSIFRSILLVIIGNAMCYIARATISNDHRHQQVSNKAANILAYEIGAKASFNPSRENYRPVTDCMFVTSDSGPFSYVSQSDNDEVCGIYFLTDPDRVVELYFQSYDVPCERHGLLAVIDGWELNGEVFPSEADHMLPVKERVNEFCGKNGWRRKTFSSSQNVALLQYKIPSSEKGFVVFAKYPKNPRPCNILSVSTTDPFTIRNYGRRINCTLIAVYPGVVRVIALGVGGVSQSVARTTTETGTLRKCGTRSPRDLVQIGGSRGLDTTKLDVIDTICGIDSKPDIRELVAYDVTSVRLISSGDYDNSVTVAISQIVNDDLLLDSASGF